MKGIVVGIDGSPESLAALRWSAREARLRGTSLTAVYAYGRPEDFNPYAVSLVMAATPTMSGGGLHSQVAMEQAAQARRDELENERQRRAEFLLDRWLQQAEDELHGVAVCRRPIRDDRPGRALLQMADDAELLVVGSRGRGGFKGLVLGSVSLQCVQHARCPVTVVRQHG